MAGLDDDGGAARRGPQPIVGIGSSAGGLHALKSFLPRIDPKTRIAYVVVQHLDPERPSSLAELLERISPLPVCLIEDGMQVEPGRVYVIPSNAVLTIRARRLSLTAPAELRGQRSTIDIFFRSLAEDQGGNAACVILSGTGSDGTLGLRAIKESGGLTMAQDGAEYDGMMRSALTTGLVDLILPVEAMPGELSAFFDRRKDTDESTAPEGGRDETADFLRQICAILRARTGHEFNEYKDKTLIRRIQRRMQVLQIDNTAEFIDRLREDASEVDLLFQDLLIGVTQFFRDPGAFEVLETQVIPKLFEGKGADDTVRAWITACSTGEEAYSIAMLLREHADGLAGSPRLQVFASDIDENALNVARAGRYSASIAANIPAKRLDRHFVREDGTYRVVSELREMCLFSLHNLLHDAPFSKLDLVSCRNLLIYLSQDLQNRVIPLFHYALRDGGFLFLGNSENVTRHSRLFSTTDNVHRIFRRRHTAERRLPEFPLTPREHTLRHPASVARTPDAEADLRTLTERQILERYAPAYVLVSATGDLLHASARTGKYLELPAGIPDHSILSMARQGLRLELRAALHQAVATGQPAVQSNVTVGTNGGRQVIDLHVQPFVQPGTQETLYLIVFQDLGGIKAVKDDTTAAQMESVSFRQLEAELRATKERLQATTEELESSNEELKSGNEELSSMNEELQSANEELETSKEELQSINEELETVNAELNTRVDELGRLNSDIANLLESTQIATVFLDETLAVKSFTPAAKDIFHLVESDAGRPIAHVRARFNAESLEEDAERVLRTLSRIERHVESTDSDARYIMRILPYRSIDNVIGGVVITFTDMTRLIAAETKVGELTRALRNRIEDLESLLDLIPVGVLVAEGTTPDTHLANRYLCELLGATPARKGLLPVPLRLSLFAETRELPPDDQPLTQAIRTGQPVPAYEARLLRGDGTHTEVLVAATPLFEDDGRTRGAIAVFVDISESKRHEARREELLHELQHRVKNILATVSALAMRMLKDAKSVDEFSNGFLPRLAAMTRMHDLLTRRDWAGVDLNTLATTALTSHVAADRKGQVVEGPAVVLKPSAAAPLGMVLHELATNSAKYGALSVEAGRIDIRWQVETADGGRYLSLVWSEHGGPTVQKSAEDGFGLSFIKRTIAYELEGTAEISFEPPGLRCAITLPMRNTTME